MIFDKFKGISEEREIIEREKTSLDYLLGSCDEIIKKYTAIDAEADEQINEAYIKICNSLKEELPEFSEQDLASLIFAKANKDYDKKESELLGLYTGVLLHILTERNAKQGKRTKFCINGRGSRFDYLFYFAKKIDELVVDSFVGDKFCANIASRGGKANKITLNNNKGNDTADSAGYNKGSISTLVINNNKGNGTARGAGIREGSIGKMMLCNITGEHTAKGAEAKQIISGEEAIAEYQKISQQYKLDKVFKLLDSFKSKTPEEIIAATEKIGGYLGK